MELLEREQFLGELEALLGGVATGNGRFVLVSGEAGIGKTSLVERFTEAHKTQVRVLWGACDALFTPRPLGPLYDIAHQTQGSLLALLEEEAQRASIFSAALDEMKPLGAIGRMALTNYLLQSILIIPVCIAFGLFDKITPSRGLFLALLIWLIQVPASVWWLKRFRFGPAEWIWRSLTSGSPQLMRATHDRRSRSALGAGLTS